MINFKWNRKLTIREGALGKTIDLKPAKKEFETMFEILRDAEKYDTNNDLDVRNVLLSQLHSEIDKFI